MAFSSTVAVFDGNGHSDSRSAPCRPSKWWVERSPGVRVSRHLTLNVEREFSIVGFRGSDDI